MYSSQRHLGTEQPTWVMCSLRGCPHESHLCLPPSTNPEGDGLLADALPRREGAFSDIERSLRSFLDRLGADAPPGGANGTHARRHREPASPAVLRPTERRDGEGAARVTVRLVFSLIGSGSLADRAFGTASLEAQANRISHRRPYSSSLTFPSQVVGPPVVKERCIIGASGRAPCQ